MVVVKLEHSDLVQHQANIFKQLHSFRKEGQLCDVVLKSCHGTEYQAHTVVLCAASVELKNMLVGSFVEAHQVQQGQPVEMAASDAVVLALLQYIYSEEPQVELEDAFELLRLADAYNFRELAAAVEAGLSASLDSAPVATALKVLQQTQDLHELVAACERKVAEHFESCIELVDFLGLSAGQLGRILRRDDLKVSREEVVVKGLFNWVNSSTDRGVHLGLLLQNVDFQSLSSDNLARLRHLSASMGPIGHDLQREVGQTLLAHKKCCEDRLPYPFLPKRHCLQYFWSPDLGASSQAPQKVLPRAYSLCWHDGAIYYVAPNAPSCSIFRWKLGDAESQAVAGRGARVNGENDLNVLCRLSVSPEGEICVADVFDRRLVSFKNGCGHVALADVDVESVSCSPSGSVYVLTQNGQAVEKVVGSTLHLLISSEHLPAELQFEAADVFATKEEAVYISDKANGRILRIKPDEAQPVVVGEAPNKESSALRSLFVTEAAKIYIADEGQRKVWAFHPGDTAWTEVLVCPGVMWPVNVLVQGRSLYVSMGGARDADGIYEYRLPPELQLTDLAKKLESGLVLPG